MKLVGEAIPSGVLAGIFDFIQRIAAAGAVNSLAQLLLKLTAPGVPDFYQGTDEWDFSLVDPDNRRAVDFARRRRRSTQLDPIDAVIRWRDGTIKMATIVRALALRRDLSEVFTVGSYEPAGVEGPMANHLLAFVRRLGANAVLTVVPRLPTRLLAETGRLEFKPDLWRNTNLLIAEGPVLMDVLDPEGPSVVGPVVAVDRLLRRLPVALLSTQGQQRPVPQVGAGG
jgi:maltooligosyltrehalose synthase